VKNYIILVYCFDLLFSSTLQRIQRSSKSRKCVYFLVRKSKRFEVTN